MKIRALLTPLLLLYACSGQGHGEGQQAFDSYFDALPLFWGEVYGEGGSTLYCAQGFGDRKGRDVNVEHVYPMAWVVRAEGCADREACRETSPRFNRIEADMHNLYPARAAINKARGSMPFGEVDGERRHYGDCDIEIDRRRRVVEPRPASRGNIARAMFYMQATYGLEIYSRQGRLLKQWHADDPPDREEMRRNERIARLQGTRNPFIDRPALAERLRF